MTLQTTPSSWEQHLFALAQADSHRTEKADRQSVQRGKNLILHKAIAVCEAITAEYSRSFYLASSLLPGDKRQAMRVLYAFCRIADNLADEDVEEPDTKLRQLRQAILGNRDIAGGMVLTAWDDIRARYQIPLLYAEQLLDGVELDLERRRYLNFNELSVYCYGVASTVGLMSMHITGYTDKRAFPYAIKLGVALQLTNILRDVGEDWSADRLYLPLDELAAFDLDENDLAAGKVDQRWRNFMRFQIDRARRLYAEAMPGISLLNPDGRFAVSAAAFLYKGILDDIEKHDFDVFNRRAFVGSGKKMVALLGAFWHAKKDHLESL